MLILPEGYSSSLDIIETQKAIKSIKDFFESNLANKLNLTRVSAPLFVPQSTGVNDNLNGVEVPVHFKFRNGDQVEVLEIVQSLAKWKRIALKNYNVQPGYGIYADMNAIRPCEITDNTHSLYVDQWDWEKVITKEQRTKEFLISTVEAIYGCLLETQEMLKNTYSGYSPVLKDNIHFKTSQELEDLYPSLSPEQREKAFCREHGALFLMEIGGVLNSGKPHDNRAPDYDDWSLNGDIIVWNPILEDCLELSSMGIRVDSQSLVEQLRIQNEEERLKLEYHSMLTSGHLPLTIGGGIGQSRICMLLLQKAHIGEVQSSVWPESMIRACKNNGINLL